MPTAHIIYSGIDETSEIVKVKITECRWINRIHMAIWFIFHNEIEVIIQKRAVVKPDTEVSRLLRNKEVSQQDEENIDKLFEEYFKKREDKERRGKDEM